MKGRREEDSAWAQMLQQNDEKHEDAHRRLRADHRELDAKHEALKIKVAALEATFEQLKVGIQAAKDAPIDVGLIVFNPKMVLAIVGLVVSILGGTWFINQPIVSRLDRFEERMSSQKDVIDGLTKAMEMRRLEIQSLGNNLQQFQQLERERNRR